VSDPRDLEQLRELAARLSAENEQLRAQLRVPPLTPPELEPAKRPIAPTVGVLLMPDPTRQPSGRGLPVLDLARTLVQILSERQPDVQWRAEHDLTRVPNGAVCYDLADALRRLFDNTQPLPKTYEVIAGEDDRPALRRRAVPGDPDSDRYLAAWRDQLQTVNDLLAEGEAAYEAGAAHHAGWAMRAVDVVLAQIALARAYFEAGRDEWDHELSKSRPEYDPRYRIDAELPAGL
jgi:hypothetical protein